MKKFEEPTIRISEFDIINIVTTSGEPAPERALTSLKDDKNVNETNIFLLTL